MITAGKDKGKKGKVEKVIADEAKALVPGLNIYKRHRKKRDEKSPGGIIEFARPLPMGNVAIVCPSCKKPVRVGFLLTDGEKYRVCKKCGEKI